MMKFLKNLFKGGEEEKMTRHEEGVVQLLKKTLPNAETRICFPEDAPPNHIDFFTKLENGEHLWASFGDWDGKQSLYLRVTSKKYTERELAIINSNSSYFKFQVDVEVNTLKADSLYMGNTLEASKPFRIEILNIFKEYREKEMESRRKSEEEMKKKMTERAEKLREIQERKTEELLNL